MDIEDDLYSSASENFPSKYKLPENCTIKIDIELHKVSSESILKHAEYAIFGNDHLGQFQVHRRYKEFKKLQELLKIQWIGAIIPELPGKKAVVKDMQGNLNLDFIEKRRKMLEYFIKKIAATEYLYLSEIFQTFLRGNRAFLKLAKDFKAVNFEKIAETYQKIFFDSNYESQNVDQIVEMDNQCTGILRVLLENKKKIKHCEKLFMKYEENHRKVLHGIKMIANDIFPQRNAEFNERTQYENPYSLVLHRIKVITLDLKSFRSALHQFLELNSISNNFQGKIVEYENLLEKIKHGKKSVITTKSIDQVQIDVQEVYKSISNENKALEVILGFLRSMYLSILPKLISHHFVMFCEAMKNFAVVSIAEYENFAAYALQIEESLKI